MASVILDNVSKSFEGPKRRSINAVKNVSLAVADKEFLVMVGPSGCGKSTLLRMISGLEEITAGTISIDGEVVNHAAPKDRDIAMVFQNYALYPHMTVYENMAFGLKLRKVAKPEIEARVREASEILGLAGLMDRLPRALSGGQRQRVAVGRAIVRKPKAFLFDEPLSNLDARMRVQMRMELAKLHARLNSTMIYVTHDQVEAMTLGDRIAILNEGVLQQVGKPLGLYHHPANLFVAGFIGSPPMNFFPGRVASAEGGLWFEAEANAGEEAMVWKPRLPGDLISRLGLETWVGKPVVMGVRPENFGEPMGAAGAGGEALEGVVEAAELTGVETYLHMKWGARAFVVRAPAHHAAEAGERLRFRCDLTKAHFFDPATTNAIG